MRHSSSFPLLRKVALLPILAVTIGSIACGPKSHPAGPSAPTGPAVATKTATVESAGSETLREVPGVVASRRSASLSARIPAAIVELPLREGERVAAGGTVVRLDDAALRSALAAAEAGREAAESDLRRLEGLASRGAATAREVEGASARAAGARAAVEGAKNELSYAVLRAPYAGRITRLPFHVGDVVGPGQLLAEVEGDGGLEVRATIEASLSGLASPGRRVAARIDGIEAPLEATIRSLSPSGDPSTHRFELRADLPSVPSLQAGLFARLLFPVTATEARLRVPASAVFERGGLSGVFIVADGKALLRWISIGESAGGWTEVRSGLAEGEKVSLDPGSLVDGAATTEVN